MCSTPWKKNIYSEVSVLDHEAINQREGTSYKTGSKAASAYWKFSQFAASLYGQKRSPSHCTYRRFYDIPSYIRRQSTYDVFRSSGKAFYDILECVSGNDCPPPNSGVGQEAWLAISVQYFLRGDFDGVKGGQGSVQASQIIPHQTRTFFFFKLIEKQSLFRNHEAMWGNKSIFKKKRKQQSDVK